MIRERERQRGGGGGSAPFTPADIANLAMWLDASDTSTITESGGAISAWADKSGNGNNATQGTGANQPTTGGDLNGLNAITFGNPKRFTYPLTWAVNTEYSVFIVEKITDGNNFNILFDANGGGDSNNDRINMRYLGGFGIFRAGQANNDLDYNKGSAFSSTTRIWLNDRGNPTWTLYESGVSRATKSNATLITAPLANPTIGYSADSGGLYYDGVMGEIIAYTRSLTTSEKNQVGNYLGTKWGVTWTNI